MSLINTINFLPAIFQTPTNQRFIGATVDQLFAPALNVPVDGYIGRTFSPTYKLSDNYVPELTDNRKHYQLEASVVVADENQNIEFNAGYTDLLDSIRNHGGIANDHQRLFASKSYSYDGHFDYDKFVNYYNYYWLPTGPDYVEVSANQVPYRNTYKVTRNESVGGYVFSGTGTHPNVQLTLARGGTYTFDIDQSGYNFWIQSLPGTAGVNPNVPTLSTRQIFGVTNNGISSGQITFQVPLASAQNFYTAMPIAESVNAAVSFHYTDIQNQLLSTFLLNFPTGLDGISNTVLLQDTSFIFINNDQDDLYWTTPAMPVGYTGADTAINRPGEVVAEVTRPSTWRVNLLATGTGDYVIQVSQAATITELQRVFVGSGQTYASKQFWLDQNLRYQLVPPITAISDYIFYQDSSDSMFTGSIKLVDNETSTIDVDADILGKKAYTSPNGIVFTNGLKIRFDTSVTPSNYENADYYVDGVGTSIALVLVDELLVPEPFGENIDTVVDYITINRASKDQNPWTRYNRWFHKDAITTTAMYNNTIANFGPNIAARRPIIEFEPNLKLFQFGKLAKNNVDYITFTSSDAFNDVEGQVTAQIDGYTIADGDRIIFANDYDVSVKTNVYQVVSENIAATTYLTLVKTDDDPILADELVLVTSGLYGGHSFWFDGSNWTQCQDKLDVNQEPLFDLVDSDGYSFSDSTVYPGIPATALVKGKTYQIQTLGTTNWNAVAGTTGVTYNIGDRITATTVGIGTGVTGFAGTKFFGYRRGTGTPDSLLGFPLSYQTFNNIGDIVFDNFYDGDTFEYISNRVSVTVNCSTGYLDKLNANLESSKLNNWIEHVEETFQSQIFTSFFDGYTLTIDGVDKAFVQIDILPAAEQTVPHLKVFVNNKLLKSIDDYQIATYGVYDIILFTSMLTVGDKIDIEIFSNSVSALGYYKIPTNLNFNPLNNTFSSITLGQIRTHYTTLLENTAISSTGNIPAQDNYLKKQSGTLIQHNSPLIYAMTFLTDPTVNFINAVELARKEYTKFKNKFLALCSTLPNLNYSNPAEGVDAILQNINSVKNSSFSWYYSDMVPQGKNYNIISYTVLNSRQSRYEISAIFDVTTLSNRAVLVYVDGVQQTLGVNYTFSTNTPTVIFSLSLTVGQTIVIKEYTNTDGNYIPETPSKLGLYPTFIPRVYLDNTYQKPTNVIQGHDGSITPAFDDFRDDYLLELEIRIFNNIKSNYSNNNINIYDITPGRFRTTDYSLREYTGILSKNFLTWCGANNVDYRSNTTFDINNHWTWNYHTMPDTVDGTALQGSWRAIYNHWFDTETPHLTPWRMVGLVNEPDWWVTRYGPAPYTSGNTLLWEDLELGYIWNNGTPFVDPRFARPGLHNFIPVNSGGILLSPTEIPIVKQRDATAAASKFSVGQGSPAETAWRRSSDYAYAIQMLLALATPAKYFSTQLDTSKFYTSAITGQFTTTDNQKINPALLSINGDNSSGSIQRTSGYINWVADMIKNAGIDPVLKLNDYFTKLSVQLNYKIGGFTDNKLITVSAEQTTPGSTSSSVIIPDSNYKIYLNKSVPVADAVYSAVIVEKTNTGYSVSGYDPTNPFFTIIPSIANNRSDPLTVNDISVKIYQDAHNSTLGISYGTGFATIQQVADFLISYERYLISRGFVFAKFDQDLQTEKNWKLSVQELLYWSQQGWAPGTIIVLNPISTDLTLSSIGAVVDEITNIAGENMILDQNFLPIKTTNFNIVRVDTPNAGNTFLVNTLDGSTICYARLNLIQHEHVLIFDNISDFGDIIYIPEQGTRQYRLKLHGYKTGGWTGALSAPGYVYNSPVIVEWNQSNDYQTGDIVMYNSFYYTAIQDIPASISFTNPAWVQIQKSAIQTGLLQNFGLNAQQFENIYDIDQPPSNELLQEYSAGLIGFRQRQFLTDLGISIPTQTKFYQGYIKEKGSLNSITALTSGNFNNVTGNISIYEEWAFKSGMYGGINSNLFKEFILDQSIFTANPIAFSLGNTFATGNIIVALNGNAMSTVNGNTNSNVYNASNLYSTTTSLYSNRENETYMTNLPSTGYAYLDDVDYTIFNMSNFTGSISNMGGGTKIWVAKDATGNWNIFRVTETSRLATSLTYALDSYGLLTFNRGHGFAAGDSMILKYFNPQFDGIYTVVRAPTPLSIILTLSDIPTSTGSPSQLQSLIRSSTITGAGTTYALNPARLSTVTDLSNATPPLNGWTKNDRVWVDNASANGWGVFTFNSPWIRETSDLTYTKLANAAVGKSIKVSSDAMYVYVGNPLDGKVHADVITVGTGISSNITNAATGFGSKIESQGNLLAISSTSNVYVYRHQSNTITSVATLSSANVAGNISSISMSTDGNWIYVGGNNVVEVWRPTLLTVVRTGVGPSNLTGNVTVYAGNIITQPTSGASGTVLSTTSGNVVYLYNTAGTFTTGNNSYIYRDGGNLITNISTITTQRMDSSWANVKYEWANIIVSTVNTGSTDFGNVIKTNSNGTQLFVSAPMATSSTVTQAGNVYLYTRSNTAFELSQTLSAQNKNQSAAFGTGLAIDNAGNLYIGVPGTITSNFPGGVVERYVRDSFTGTYIIEQILAHPNNDVGSFGTSISASNDSRVVAIGSLGSSSGEDTWFDNESTVIDTNTTRFIDRILGSGATYIFEPLIDTTIVGTNGKYIYVQDLEEQVYSGDLYGFTVDVVGNVIAVGAPGSSLRTATGEIATLRTGAAYLFNNTTGKTAWVQTRTQLPKVDLDSIGRTILYNKSNNNILAALDYVDPAKGKVLNSVAQDIDYQQATDPALYNVGPTATQADLHWGPQQIGRVWWNLDTVRYIDYEQDSLIYRLTHWGEQFPGSSIDVYEWTENLVRPSQYKDAGGIGTPLNATDTTGSYSTNGYVDDTGRVRVKYYYWVSGLDTVSVAVGKTNSVISIANAIKNPQSQGIPYTTILRNDTVVLYNVNQLLTGQNTVLHLASQIGEPNLVHSEYALVQEGNPSSHIPASMLDKLIDSLAGVDRAGNTVPDDVLPISQRYGISIRPRQTMIIDRTTAFLNYVELVNSYLLAYPVVQRKVLTTLNNEEPLPLSDEYDISVATDLELTYISTGDLATGYKVLVQNDATYQTKWAIYELDSNSNFVVAQVQSYKTNLYWSYTTWYDSSFDPTSTIEVTVDTNLDLGKLTLVADDHVLVLNAGNNKFAIYHVDTNLALNLVGVEDGTIQINSGTIPSLELRNILLAIQQDILVDDLADKFNKLFFTTIKYILSEQKNLDWVFKTSFISAIQRIRKLEEFPTYIPDNQNFYLSYIEEVKPYRSVIREFVVDYIGNDVYGSDITDFDLPPYWDTAMQVYRSPSGEQSYDTTLLSTGVYSQWNNNYKYGISNIIVQDSGADYITPPQVVIGNAAASGANAYSVLDVNGGISHIVITNPGSGYIDTPTITINGAGTGARAYAILRNVYDDNNTGHNLVRSITTNIKFDRVGYTSANTFVFWDSLGNANVGQSVDTSSVIVSNNQLYKLSNTHIITANLAFPVSQVYQINANIFNNANDRIVAFNGNIDLSLVGDGIIFPGVQVDGNTFTGNTVDSTISSLFTANFGVDPSTIIVDGGQSFYGIFHSHAPQELVPGRMFDSLDIKIFSNVAPNTNQYAYRIFNGMDDSFNRFYRISTANTTTLSSNVSLTDDTIHVTDATKLQTPNTTLAIPGVIFVNGEKITYYRNYATETVIPWQSNLVVSTGTLVSYGNLANIVLTNGNVQSNVYLTTGNVYTSVAFGNIVSNVTLIDTNSLGRIRRATWGTSPSTIHYANTFVVDSGIRQEIPNTNTATSNIGIANVAYTTTANVSVKLRLNSNISANIGDYITQKFANTTIAANLRVLETVTSVSNIAVILISGTVTNLAGNLVLLNATATSANIIGTPTTIGMVASTGNVTLSANTTVITGTVFGTVYSTIGTLTNVGNIHVSTTEQALFLKASPGYIP